MLAQTVTLQDNPEDLRSFTARPLAELKAQVVLIEKLRHQLAGHRGIGSGHMPVTSALAKGSSVSQPFCVSEPSHW